MQLRIDRLSKTYPNGVHALRDVTLTIEAGMFGLLGRNGAGKSTLMRTLATLQDADGGSAVLAAAGGPPIDILREKERLRGVLGYLPQDFGLYPKVSAEDLLDHFARLKGVVDGKERKATVDALLKRVNLHDVRKRALGGFSGGMRQRFGIAQALIGEPKLVIVDEPTAGLDPEERVRFHNLLAEIAPDVVVILSTHIVGDVADLCSQFAIIDQGRVLAAGAPAALVSTLDGRIWEKVAGRDEIEALKANHRVVSTRLSAGRTVVRAFAPERPAPGFDAAAPELEDVYFASVAGYLGAASEAVPA